MGALDARRMTRAKLWRAGLGCEAADGSSVVRLARWGTWEVHDSKAAINRSESVQEVASIVY